MSAPDPLATVLARLNDAKPHAGSWQARCPAHPDKSPSLSLSRGDDGKALVKCFAGCAVADIVKSLGLSLSDLFIPKEIVGSREIRYEIKDIAGKLAAVHVRRDLPDGSKAFSWLAADGSTGLAGRRTDSLPLYRSEKLILVPSKSVIYVTEGEKAADALGLLGLNATATVCGANACPTVATLKPYAGYKLILWPDNDESGRSHMQRVARAATEAGADVVILTWPDAGPKGDAADFVQRGGTAAQIASMPLAKFTEADLWHADLAALTAGGDGEKTLAAPEVTIEATGRIIVHWGEPRVRVLLDQLDKRRDGLHCFLAVQRQVGDSWRWLSPRSRQNLYSVSGMEGLQKRLDNTWSIAWRERLNQVVVAADEMMNRAEPVIALVDETDPGDRVWMLAPLLEVGEVTVIFADGGIGKSLFCLACAISISSGTPILPGLAPALTCPVLYLDWETNSKEQRRRMGQIAAGMSIAAPGSLYYRRMAGPLQDAVEHLRAIIVEKRIGLVVLDSAGYATDGDINDAAVALILAAAIRALGVTTLVIAHVPKEKENRDRPIGSVYFHNAARSTWMLVKEQQSGESSVTLGLVQKKSNNGPLHAAIAFRVDFQQDVVRYYRADVQASATTAALTSDADQIAAVLRSGAMTVAGITSELGWPTARSIQVRAVLNRYRQRFVRLGQDGREAEWGLLSRADANLSVTTSGVLRVTNNHVTDGERNNALPKGRGHTVTRSPSHDITPDRKEQREPVTDDDRQAPAW